MCKCIEDTIGAVCCINGIRDDVNVSIFFTFYRNARNTLPAIYVRLRYGNGMYV